MAKDGRKLELYEILAAKRAKGKVPLGLEAAAKQANTPAPEQQVTTPAPGIIIDDSIGDEYRAPWQAESAADAAPEDPPRPAPTPPPPPQAKDSERQTRAVGEPVVVTKAQTRREYIPLEPAPETMQQRPTRRYEKAVPPPPAALPAEPEPEPRPHSPRELVIALDTGLIFFTVVLALLGCSYFIGYKRGQEERPAGLAGLVDIETADPERLNLRTLAPAPRAAFRPPEDGYTLIIRKEPATENDLPERLELELAEAVARGRNAAGREVPGFIFRTVGNDPHYILAVGLGQSANDQGLNELLQVYYAMEGVTLSREPAPYRGSRIAPVRELGTPVY